MPQTTPEESMLPLETPHASSSVDVDPVVSSPVSTNSGRKGRQAYKCRPEDHSDTSSDSEEEDDGVLRPNCRGRWFSCLGADYGPKDYKWYGVHPRLGMRYGRLGKDYQTLYERLGPDWQHEEAALTLLEKAETDGLENVQLDTFKGMMVQGNTANEWTLGVRSCAMGPSTYSHARNHLLTSVHAPIAYRCPVPRCQVTTHQEWDMKRHLRHKHDVRNVKAPLQEIVKRIKNGQQPVRNNPQSALHSHVHGAWASSGPGTTRHHDTTHLDPRTARPISRHRQHTVNHRHPYDMDNRRARVQKHSGPPQPAPQNLSLGYDPQFNGPSPAPLYDTLSAPPPVQWPPAPIEAPQRQLSRPTVAFSQPPANYGLTHDQPYFPFASQFSNDANEYAAQDLEYNKYNKEYLPWFSEGVVPSSRCEKIGHPDGVFSWRRRSLAAPLTCHRASHSKPFIALAFICLSLMLWALVTLEWQPVTSRILQVFQA